MDNGLADPGNPPSAEESINSMGDYDLFDLHDSNLGAQQIGENVNSGDNAATAAKVFQVNARQWKLVNKLFGADSEATGVLRWDEMDKVCNLSQSYSIVCPLT